MCKISNGLKTLYFPNGKHILTNSDKSLKFEETEYLIHHVKVEIWPALDKFSILFSAMKFKLRHSISQVIKIFKIGTCKFFPNSQREGKSGFLNVASTGIVNYSQFLEEFPSFSLFTKQLKNQDFFPCFYILSDCKDCLSGRVYVMGSGANNHYVIIL